ncbi:serine acetyltransferase [Actinosynnema sp. NPDC020468]|uniref:serine O-acetyltransferase n=1 Tax=Actinosynnema sp. NPDC020468 TaxID=3154488 RepID=UPI0033D9EF73
MFLLLRRPDDAWAADLAAHGVTAPGPLRELWLLATRPGLLALRIARLQQRTDRRARHVSHLLRSVNHFLTGADLSPGCVLGPGVRLEHPNGVVIGCGAVVGRGAFICQRVTLGERLGRGEPAYPVVGDDVFLGAGATVLGGVRIGDGARIGAGAVVLHDVPAGATAVGNPARLIP